MQLCQAAKIGLMEKVIFLRETKMQSIKDSKIESLETPMNSLAAVIWLSATIMQSKETVMMLLETATAW